jgi:hypothetical protein
MSRKPIFEARLRKAYKTLIPTATTTYASQDRNLHHLTPGFFRSFFWERYRYSSSVSCTHIGQDPSRLSRTVPPSILPSLSQLRETGVLCRNFPVLRTIHLRLTLAREKNGTRPSFLSSHYSVVTSHACDHVTSVHEADLKRVRLYALIDSIRNVWDAFRTRVMCAVGITLFLNEDAVSTCFYTCHFRS